MANHTSNLHHRRSIRLTDYDYTTPGAYFVTICTHNHRPLFGNIVDGRMLLNEIGRVVADEWERSSNIRDEIEIETFVVMPNHLHGIVIIHEHGANSNVRATGRSPLRNPRGPTSKSLGAFIAGYKSAVTKRVNVLRAIHGARLWHRGYYDHVIRKTDDLVRIREYIVNNPLRWEFDRENPEFRK